MSSKEAKRELQPEQAAAAYEIKKHVSVTAGPGSGKTTVLVERYLHILREKSLNIDQVVAITFTNRAANEMRERLRQRLNQILKTAMGKDRRRWLGYKRTLDGAVITTIHGFCSRLLREFPVEARIDPQFLLLDEHRAAMLLDAVVEETLSEFISLGYVEISRLTLCVGRGKLADALAQLYRDVRGQVLSVTDLAMQTAESHATEDDHARALVELSSTMNDFLRVRRTTPKSLANKAKVSSSWVNLRPLVHTIPEPEGLADYCRAIEGFRDARPNASGAVVDQVKVLDTLVWEKNLLGRVPQICLDLFARQYALEMVSLLTRIDERLNEEKQKLSALDFDDLELRALGLLDRPEVLARAGERYKFFLVDEFQDTNGLQRRLLEKLALPQGRQSANLFIVGDRKQSIYGFRGADVDVFREMTNTLIENGGESKPLRLNFRSQPPLVNFFNYLFERLFKNRQEITPRERDELGFVEHEPSEAKREQVDTGALIELMITTTAEADDEDAKAEQTSRELDAEQLARRINALTNAERNAPKFSDIALLFRAMSNVQTYETVFRRANIPHQTILGKGFYEREEIVDLIQLLRFLDNKTDELALSAVLRSPLCGISDNALLALRCAPWLGELDSGDQLRHFTKVRPLFYALDRHGDIAFINDQENLLLDRAAALIKDLIARRHHYALGELLRFAVEQSEYMAVIAATFEGPQRLANVQRLFSLAERFDRSGTHLIRDFVRYVEEFEAIGSRESEGQIDEATNAVRLMTIHQAKGLEFPIVVIPDLQRSAKPPDNWVLLDRQRGLTLKVPDGRGRLVAGSTFNRFEQRHALREQFESMRLLYVAATRAQDRLILSGTTKDLDKIGLKNDTWLNWIWQSLELPAQTRTGIIDLGEDSTTRVQLQVTLNIADEQPAETSEQRRTFEETRASQFARDAQSISEAFPLLSAIEPERDRAVHRFSVTQLINYQRCPRQYYFDRVLHAPAPDALAVWNDAEAPEPPANLTATLKGAVIHRFCETYTAGTSPEELLRLSFADVVRLRQAELADRLTEINGDEAIAELLPLAQNYLSSAVFERVEQARAALSVSSAPAGAHFAGDGNNKSLPGIRVEAGLWSELSFRLRRPLGILSGAIDKLLITPVAGGKGFRVEIIDFKTNRLRHRTGSTASLGPRAPSPASPKVIAQVRDESPDSERVLFPVGRARRRRPQHAVEQIPLDFSALVAEPQEAVAHEFSLDDEVRLAASDYQLQMQAYALAVGQLLTSSMEADIAITSTLHFLDPNVEFHLDADLLSPDDCMRAIDQAMREIVSSAKPAHFPVLTAGHCRMCNFLGICPAGREYVRALRRAGADSVDSAKAVEAGN